MRKLIVFMHISIDGFTARPNGSMDWIQMQDEMFSYAQERTKHADAALYGRKTYELMDAYWPGTADRPGAPEQEIEYARWYMAVDKYVVSENMRGKQLEKTTIISGNIKQQVSHLKRQPGREIIMFGSPGLASYLMNENLIDEYWLFIYPVILGAGISLFGKNTRQTNLQLEKSIPFSGGAICLHYLSGSTVATS
jgi:dihydrofolate reductase